MNVSITAYAPIGNPSFTGKSNMLQDPVVTGIAEKHGKSAA
jgi:diketogulonate reductase-like aldo/keto reductase